MVRFHLLPPIAIPRGDITQLVECLLCKQNVAGSNPTISTNQTQAFCQGAVVHLNRGVFVFKSVLFLVLMASFCQQACKQHVDDLLINAPTPVFSRLSARFDLKFSIIYIL